MGFDLDGCALPAPGRRSYPLAVSLKGVAADEARHERGTAAMQLRILAALEGRSARGADRVIVPSSYSAAQAARAYGLEAGRISVVPEGIDLGPWNALHDDPPARDDPRPTILSVARQYPRKNTRTLLDAIPRVAGVIADVRLRVVGGGPELHRLRERARCLGIAERVEFLGAVPEREAVRAEYFRADCFCLPSLQEGFGIVFLEAMAAGLPVVAARVAAVPEVVVDGETGLLVDDPRDPRALAHALLRVLESPERARDLGRAGRDRARWFGHARMADRFLAAVEEIGRTGAPEERP